MDDFFDTKSRGGAGHLARRAQARRTQAQAGRWMMLVVVGGGIALSGCSDNSSTGPAPLPGGLFALKLDQHAITMSVAPPANTIQLHATPVTAVGTPISGLGQITYSIMQSGGGTDTSIVVTSSGLVTARAPSYSSISGYGASYEISAVIASLTVQGVTFADTAYLRVTATAPSTALDSFSIHPPPDSLAIYQSGHWLAANTGQGKLMNVTTLDASHAPLLDTLVWITTSDPSVAIGSHVGQCTGALLDAFKCVYGIKGNATVTFYAQTWYYGVARSDSLQIKVGYEQTAQFNAQERTPWDSLTSELYWWPTVLNLTAPAKVSFINMSTTTALDAVFDDPAAIQSDTGLIHFWAGLRGFAFPLSAPGNVAPFYMDTTGGSVACATGQDSLCYWKGLYHMDRQRSVLITTPGTYPFHTRFGNGGTIIVH